MAKNNAWPVAVLTRGSDPHIVHLPMASSRGTDQAEVTFSSMAGILSIALQSVTQLSSTGTPGTRFECGSALNGMVTIRQ